MEQEEISEWTRQLILEILENLPIEQDELSVETCVALDDSEDQPLENQKIVQELPTDDEPLQDPPEIILSSNQVCEEDQTTVVENSPEEQHLKDSQMTKQPDIVDEIIQSILTPGLSGRILAMMHASFFALTLTLVALLVLTLNIHVLFLLIITGCLWASISWFVVELNKKID
jgi:hypothetical protein